MPSFDICVQFDSGRTGQLPFAISCPEPAVITQKYSTRKRKEERIEEVEESAALIIEGEKKKTGQEPMVSCRKKKRQRKERSPSRHA